MGYCLQKLMIDELIELLDSTATDVITSARLRKKGTLYTGHGVAARLMAKITQLYKAHPTAV